MAEKMRAIRKLESAPGLTLCEIPVPRPGPDEVLIKVEAASVCGTDLHIHQWDQWSQNRVRPPLTLGHEFAGTVVEIGGDVRHVDEGDYVSAESHITCGMCFRCRTGQAHMCEQTRILGVDREGAFAEYVTVPEAVVWKNDRTKLPPEIATLQEPFGNAVFATSSQELTGKSVAVLGCGPIGLFTIAIARASGASNVWAADRTPYRLELARKMGATGTVNVSEEKDSVAWFKDQNEGYGLDVVFEMSGSPKAITDSFQIAVNGGRVILFGIPSKKVELDIAESLIFKNLSVLALNGRRIFETWYKTRWMLESGVVDLRPLITHRYTLDQMDLALGQLEAGEACKIVMYPGKDAETTSKDIPGEGREEVVGILGGRPAWSHR